MTQLALGWIVIGAASELFDERNDAAKALLLMAIRAAKKQGTCRDLRSGSVLTMKTLPHG
ncbi:hypothetical protein ACNKHL_09030 [Shigella flexneri]